MRSLAYFAVFLLSLVASAHSTLVYLRVEGANDTIYESRRLIPARAQDTTNGTNPCSGLNGGVNTEPGATCTSALAAAAKTWDFTFDGRVLPSPSGTARADRGAQDVQRRVRRLPHHAHRRHRAD
jgi:hypothetical protein